MSVTIDNPVFLLESIGISEFKIDFDKKIIYLPEIEFLRAIKEFERSPLCYSFTEVGWTWVKEEYDKERPS